jgi:uncharacterized protein
MPNPRNPLRLNVGFIISSDVGYTHEFPFDYDKLKVADDLILRDFHGTLHIGRTPQGLLVTGQFESVLKVECVRCLCEFDYTTRWEMTEMYAFNEKSVTESGLILPEDAHIDLAPIVRDYALTEVPISPICKPDCQGLCTVCGQDLNKKDCGHRDETDDSPFSALKDLLKN